MKQLFEGRLFSSGLFYDVMKLSNFANLVKEGPLEICYPVGYNGNILRNQKNHIIPN